MTEPYRDEVGQQPLARAVLAKLAATRNADDAVGSFARAVLNGDASLRTAAAHSWHGQALGPAFDQALKTLRELPADERDAIERQAQRIRDHGDADIVNEAISGNGTEEDQ
ncbi:hypothetical protein C6361_07795 [Plantactinospora sp. BC1]|uniref:hypothetical protein n=1 Tax=Plantactinospora sp. BC1 TaxID=2108470 RepID=UPI000D17CDC4|nr:hypothetical protein [Plantactinospora sp. BC1]AVT29411.1 hypothetical protein C6361_07795 [Plantactinospora sp. BC1]